MDPVSPAPRASAELGCAAPTGAHLTDWPHSTLCVGSVPLLTPACRDPQEFMSPGNRGMAHSGPCGGWGLGTHQCQPPGWQEVYQSRERGRRAYRTSEHLNVNSMQTGALSILLVVPAVSVARSKHIVGA